MLLKSQPALAVRFLPAWEHIEPLREYVTVCTRVNSAAADRAGIVVQELLENAVKYGDPSATIELVLDVDTINRAVEIRVTNRAHASRLAVLKAEFEKLSSTSPHDAFAKALSRLRKLPQGSSMLGLPRLAVEAKLTLEIVDDSVSITARVV